MTKKRDLTGQRFGRLLVIKELPKEVGQKSQTKKAYTGCVNATAATSASRAAKPFVAALKAAAA